MQVNLQCTLKQVDYSEPPLPDVDVTARAQWTASNPAIATVSTTGFVAVLGHGELDITASYADYAKVWSVLVDPQQSPQIIYFLSGLIRENDGSDTRIPGAVVEILDGYNAAKASSLSNEFGAYRIDRILTKVTFTVRASKTGYLPSTTTYEVDGPIGNGNAPFLDFRLSSAPQ